MTAVVVVEPAGEAGQCHGVEAPHRTLFFREAAAPLCGSHQGQGQPRHCAGAAQALRSVPPSSFIRLRLLSVDPLKAKDSLVIALEQLKLSGQ